MATPSKQVLVNALGEETEGAHRATGVSSPSAGAAAAASAVSVTPDPEVVEQARRRRVTAQYKRKVLEQADRCEPGQLGALLRREGLYSSHLTCWRRQREAGALAGLAARQRGRPAPVPDVHRQQVAALERENARLRQRLLQAETMIDVQKKSRSCWGWTRARQRTPTGPDDHRCDLGQAGRRGACLPQPGGGARHPLSAARPRHRTRRATGSAPEADPHGT
jgi:transposase